MTLPPYMRDLIAARADNGRLRGLYDSATDQAVRYAAEIARLTAEFKLIIATAPWSDKDGHSECLRIARRALANDNEKVAGYDVTKCPDATPEQIVEFMMRGVRKP